MRFLLPLSGCGPISVRRDAHVNRKPTKKIICNDHLKFCQLSVLNPFFGSQTNQFCMRSSSV